jgi:hypothetical protein
MRLYPNRKERAQLLYILVTAPCGGLPVFPAAYLYHTYHADFFVAYGVITAILFGTVSFFFRKRLIRAFGGEDAALPASPRQPERPLS